MRQHLKTLELATTGRGLTELTGELRDVVRESGVDQGLAVMSCLHTSASLVVMENADPSVLRDLEGWLSRLAPDGDPHHIHTAEGPDDMPAHLRSASLRTSETFSVQEGRPQLGTWQGVFLYEHRLAPHRRRVSVHVMG